MGYNISNAWKLQFCKQPFEIIQGQIAFKNTVQCVNKQTAVLLLNPGTEYKRLAQMLERGISFKANSRTGCQFGVPGGTYPPKKYPSAPPPGLTSKAREKRPGDEVAIACGDTPVTWRISCTELLGVRVDQHLTWKTHVLSSSYGTLLVLRGL